MTYHPCICRAVRRYTTVFSNSGCTPWATHSCFAAWPAHTATLPQRLLLVLSFSYYLYELAGMAVGVGTALKYDMVAHHVVCMTLFVIGWVSWRQQGTGRMLGMNAVQAGQSIIMVPVCVY